MKAMKAKKAKGFEDRQGQACQVARFQGWKGEDQRRPEEERSDQEQERQSGEQEVQPRREEGLRSHQGVDSGLPAGKESSWSEGLCGHQEGHNGLQQGEAALREEVRKSDGSSL